MNILKVPILHLHPFLSIIAFKKIYAPIKIEKKKCRNFIEKRQTTHPQKRKKLSIPSGLFSRQGPGSIFQNATLKNLHLFPLAFRNSAGANISPIRPDLKRGLRQSACDFYCTCRTALQPIPANPIRFLLSTHLEASLQTSSQNLHPKNKEIPNKKEVALATPFQALVHTNP